MPITQFPSFKDLLTDRQGEDHTRFQTYVVGFLFRHDPELPEGIQVALIHKQRPAWQAGLLNGIGGKCETGEHAIEAMPREFKEETGADVQDWAPLKIIVGEDYAVVFFTSWSGDGVKIESLESEQVGWWDVCPVTHQILGPATVPNLRWVVPFAMERQLMALVIDAKGDQAKQPEPEK